MELVQKQEITSLIYVDTPDKTDIMKFVTTTNDGFIKMNEVDIKKKESKCIKSFFVCKNGISLAC